MNRIFFLVFSFFFLVSALYSCSDESAGRYKKDDEIAVCDNGNWCINGEDTQISAHGEKGTPGSTVSICDGYWCIDGVSTNTRINEQNCSLTPDASADKITIACDENPAISINNCTVSETVLSISVKCGEREMEWLKDPAFDPTEDVEMLGLVPGKDISELNLTWWSTKPDNKNCPDLKSLVRLIKEDGTVEKITPANGDVNFGNVAPQYRINSNNKCYHQATLSGLEDGKKYTYSVSADGETIGAGGEEREWNRKWSREYNYTAPVSGTSFKFAAVGDPQLTAFNTGANKGKQDPYSKYASQTTVNGWKETVKKIAAEGAQFIVSVGDQVDTENYSEHEYQNFFAPPELHSIPLAPTIGNHDMHCIYYSHYNMPNLRNKPSVSDLRACNPTDNKDGQIIGVGKGNYFYSYNNVLFVALNTAPYPENPSEAENYVTEYQAVIDAAKAAYPSKDWLIVQHHKSTKSVANHASDIDIYFYVQAGLEKLMNDNGVDLVLSGHDHIYVRSHLMKWDPTATLKNPPPVDVGYKGHSIRSADGDSSTLYLTLTTASGLKYYPMFAGLACTSQNCLHSPYIPVLIDSTAGREELRINYADPNASIVKSDINLNKLPLSMSLVDQKLVPTYTMFNVNGTTMRVTTKGIDGSYIDTFTLTKSGTVLTIN